MTVEQYLAQPKKLDIETQQLRQQIEELMTTLTSVTVDLSKEHVDGGVQSDQLGLIERLAAVEAELDRKLIDKTVLRGKIVLEIQSLDDPRYVWVLYRRYIDNMKWEDIAELPPLYPAFDTAKKWHTEAKRAFDEKFGTLIHALM